MSTPATTPRTRTQTSWLRSSALLAVAVAAAAFAITRWSSTGSSAVTMSDIKNVIIAGGSGTLGSAVVKEFLGSDFKVSVLSRADSKTTFPDNVNVVKTDYTAESLKSALAGQDAVISVLGSFALGDQQLALIDAAVAAGVKRFIPSEFGSNTANPEVVALVPVFAGKQKIVAALKSKESATFSWTSVINGPFFDSGLKNGFLGVNLTAKKVTLWDEGTARFSATKLSTIGKALVLALKPENFAKTANKYLYIESYTITQSQLRGVLEKVTGGAAWEAEKLDSRAVEKDASERLKNHDFSAVVPLIAGVSYGYRVLGDFSTVGLSNEALGLPKDDLEADVKEVLASL